MDSVIKNFKMSKLLYNYLMHLYNNMYLEDEVIFLEINQKRFLNMDDDDCIKFKLDLGINTNSDDIMFRATYLSSTFSQELVMYEYNINTDKIKIKNGYDPNHKIIIYISNTLINFINKYKDYIYILVHFKSLLLSENDVMWD